LVVVLFLLNFLAFTTTTSTTTKTTTTTTTTLSSILESNDAKRRTSQQQQQQQKQQQQQQNKQQQYPEYPFPSPPPPRTILLDSAEVSKYFRLLSKFNRLNATHYTETQLSNFDINFPDDENMSINRTLKKFNLNDPININTNPNNEKARKAMMMSGGPMYDDGTSAGGDFESDGVVAASDGDGSGGAGDTNDNDDDDNEGGGGGGGGYGDDDDEKNSLYTLPAKVILSTLAATASLITICGNVLVMVSFFLDRQIRIPTNYFILSLAVSDFLIGLFSMPLYTLYLMLGSWPFGEIICNLWLSLDYTVCLTSIYTVLFITIDRFCSVKIPAKYRKWRSRNKIIIMVALTWIIPISLFFTAIFIGNYARQEKFDPKNCDVTWSSNFVFNFTLVVSYFWSTLLVMIVLYIFIYQVARNLERKSREKQRKLSSLVGCSASNTGALVGVVALPSNMSGVVKPMAAASVGGGAGGGIGMGMSGTGTASGGGGPNDHHHRHNSNAQTPPDDIEEFDEDFNTDSQSKLSKGSIKRRKKDHLNFIKRTSKTTGIALVTAISGVAHGGQDEAATGGGRGHGHKDKKHSAAAANAKKHAQAAKCVNMNGPPGGGTAQVVTVAPSVASAAAKKTPAPSTAAATINAPAAAISTTTFANSSTQTKGANVSSSLSSTGAWNSQKKPPPSTENNNNTNSTMTTTTTTTKSASASTWGNNLNPISRRLTGTNGGNNNNKAFVSSTSSYSRCGVDLEDISSSYESHSDYDSSTAAQRSGRRRTNSDFEQNTIELSVTNSNNNNNNNNTSNTLRAYLGQRSSSSVDRKMSTIEAGEKLRHHHHLHQHNLQQQRQLNQQQQQQQQQQQPPQSLQPRPETLAVMSHDLFAEKCSVKQQLQQSSSKLFSSAKEEPPPLTVAADAEKTAIDNEATIKKAAAAAAAASEAANEDGGGELQAAIGGSNVVVVDNNNNNSDISKFPSSSFKDQIPFIDEEFDDLSYILHRRQFDNEKVQIKEETILIKSPLKSSFFQKFSSPIKSFSRKSSQKAMAAAAAAAAAVAAVAQSADSAQVSSFFSFLYFFFFCIFLF
jgi:muscarinic acetylcholine receptor M3